MWHSLLRMLDRAGAEAWQFVVAFALCLLLPALAAAALWPAGRAGLALSFLKGYCVLWVAVAAAHWLASLIQRRLRVDLYSHPDAFVVSNLLVSSLLTAGWAAFAALATHDAAAGAGLWLAGVVYLFGLLSCVAASQVVGSFYSGQLYKFASLLLACAGFVAFAVWPAAARVAFGWLYRDF